MLEMQGFLKVFSRVVCKEKSCFFALFFKKDFENSIFWNGV